MVHSNFCPINFRWLGLAVASHGDNGPAGPQETAESGLGTRTQPNSRPVSFPADSSCHIGRIAVSGTGDLRAVAVWGIAPCMLLERQRRQAPTAASLACGLLLLFNTLNVFAPLGVRSVFIMGVPASGAALAAATTQLPRPRASLRIVSVYREKWRFWSRSKLTQ
jgi:hypothetical protein